MNKVLLIINPKAGKAKSEKYVSKIINNLKENNYDVVLEYTTIEEDAPEIVAKYKDIENIIVWGGDGTLLGALQGLSITNKKPKIAFIPMGTTNDFAKSLKISFDKLDVSKNLNSYEIKEVDLGKCDSDQFNYVVSMGLFSRASYKTSRKWKNRIGKAAYYINGIKELFNYKTYKLKITSKEKNIEDDFLYGSVSNSKYMGGFPIYRKKDVELDDGKFEVLLVKEPKHLYSTIILIIKILTGNLEDKHICYFKTEEIEIESIDGIDLSIDGEYGGKRKKFKISNLRKQTKYLVPVKI
ncbi:MAG: diacylglycerol kinase family lipid kinase [Clostridia bacterium]|nr:diacylglycerol kinase family lipid kinase [Clostridia bacterium]